jgi:hypothetical protein
MSWELTICMSLKVIGNTTKEGFLPKVAAEHPNHGASFEIADMIKDLINLKSIFHGHFNGMGCS